MVRSAASTLLYFSHSAPPLLKICSHHSSKPPGLLLLAQLASALAPAQTDAQLDGGAALRGDGRGCWLRLRRRGRRRWRGWWGRRGARRGWRWWWWRGLGVGMVWVVWWHVRVVVAWWRRRGRRGRRWWWRCACGGSSEAAAAAARLLGLGPVCGADEWRGSVSETGEIHTTPSPPTIHTHTPTTPTSTSTNTTSQLTAPPRCAAASPYLAGRGPSPPGCPRPAPWPARASPPASLSAAARFAKLGWVDGLVS